MITTDLKAVATYLTAHKLWDKAFRDLDEWEIRRLCEAILEATNDKAGVEVPYLKGEQLVIPFKAPLKYRWWQGGQSLAKTLAEMGASDEVARLYIHSLLYENEGKIKK